MAKFFCKLALLSIVRAPTSATPQSTPTDPCLVTAGARTFDLSELASPLRHVSQQPDSHGWTYSFSACGHVPPSVGGPGCGAAAPSSAVLQQTAGACYGLGSTSTRTVEVTASGLTLSFSGGDGGRSTVVTVDCADVLRPEVVGWGHGAKPLTYVARVRARAGCALECRRDSAGAVCGGSARGICTYSNGTEQARCICAEGRSGQTCSDRQRLVSQTVKNTYFGIGSMNLNLPLSVIIILCIIVTAFRASRRSLHVLEKHTILYLVIGAVWLFFASTMGSWKTKTDAAEKLELGLSHGKLRVALAVVVLGPAYHAQYMKLFHESHAAYAKKYSYNLSIFSEWISSGPGPSVALSGASMQKYALLNTVWAQNFDYVVYLDADILINPSAPAVHLIFPSLGRGIGAVDEYEEPTGRFEDRVYVQRAMKWEDSPQKYYALAGFDLNTTHVLNGGMMIFQPALHSKFAMNMSTRYDHQSRSHPRGMHFEQAATGFELITQGMWARVPPVWNALWIIQRLYPQNIETLQQFIDRNYFVHLAGGDAGLLGI